jgi:hypothetical protein
LVRLVCVKLVAVPRRSWVPLVQADAGVPPVLKTSLYVFDVARPLPPSEKPDQLRLTWAFPAVAVRLPFVGAV